MIARIKQFNMDKRGYLFMLSRRYRFGLSYYGITVFTRLMCRMKGVFLGQGVLFNGKICMERLPHSTIRIGNSCVFNSGYHSNPIGLFSRCRISTVTKTAEILIGNAVGMSGVTINAAEHVSIGDETLIGGNCLITDTDWHPLSPEQRHSDVQPKTAPVVIGKNVFIGARTVILKGTCIGDNSVIGAGSVVCGTIPSNVVAAGNPCRVIKKLSDYE